MLENFEIILASQSPRRQELLAGLDIQFSVKTISGLEENYSEELIGEEIPKFLARQKAEAFSEFLKDNTLIITADTIVWLNGKVYGKPANADEAKIMLRELSGQTHEVITGVCVTSKFRQEAFSAISKVTFATLTDEEIDYYISRYQPYDKAGSYGVQEWIGYIGVEKIEGSYYNVMGLPIQRLYKVLKNWEKVSV